MTRPTISIAMATYNGEKYLQEQLDSFLTQTRPPDELVVCDDGSKDRTLEILAAFQASASFAVHLYKNNERLGCAKTFDKALSLCKCDSIFLSDQDDVWFPEKIETVISVFDTKKDIIVVLNDQIITDEKLSHSGITKLQNISSMGLNDSCFVSGCCTAMRRVWLDLALPIPADQVPHDIWINRLATALGVRVILSKPLQYSRRHGSNTSNWLASRSTKVSKLEVIRANGLKDASPGWINAVALEKIFVHRLRQRSSVIKSLQREDAARVAKEKSQRKIEALETRIGFVALPRTRRVPFVVRFLADGEYRYFSGWKSALKDICQRQSKISQSGRS